jgi:riboflavin biosynthesis pyrimidine reductase
MISINPRVTKDNIKYLATKAERFHHLIDIQANSYHSPEIEKLLRFVNRAMAPNGSNGPLVTLFFDQTLNGNMADPTLSRPPEISKELTALRHRLRSKHQAVLVDLRSPNLDPPNGDGNDPLIVSWDQDLQQVPQLDPTTLPSNLLILARAGADDGRGDLLERQGVSVVYVPPGDQHISILAALWARGVSSIMVEGPSEVLRSMLFDEQVRLMIGLMGPYVSEKKDSEGGEGFSHERHLKFKEMNYLKIGSSLIYYGVPERDDGQGATDPDHM